MSDLGISGKRIRKKPKYLRDDEEDDDEPAAKQHKNGKSKKQKKDKEKSSKKKSQPAVAAKPKDKPKQGIKLKIKLGGKSIGKTSIEAKTVEEHSRDSFIVDDDSDNIDVEGEALSSTSEQLIDEHRLMDEDISNPYISDDNTQTSLISSTKPNADGNQTSDEEREWLEAIESGDIEDYEKKKAVKNPALLTARQRRLLHGEEEEQLIELPSLYKNKTLTEEQLNVRKQRAVKRRQQALEKNEKAKKQTVDRLLKKSSDSTSSKAKSKSSKQTFPHVRYMSKKDSLSLSFPANFDSPLTAQAPREPLKPILCGIKGCKNPKRYNCSKTNTPLCSLQCYQKNLTKIKPDGKRKAAVT